MYSSIARRPWWLVNSTYAVPVVWSCSFEVAYRVRRACVRSIEWGCVRCEHLRCIVPCFFKKNVITWTTGKVKTKPGLLILTITAQFPKSTHLVMAHQRTSKPIRGHQHGPPRNGRINPGTNLEAEPHRLPLRFESRVARDKNPSRPPPAAAVSTLDLAA